MTDKLFMQIVLDQLVECGGVADAPVWNMRWQQALEKMQREGLIVLGERVRRFFRDRADDGMYVRVTMTEDGRAFAAQGKVGV